MSRQRPNVIVIVSDDHGYADRSALGIHPQVHTPALDRLAATGVSCDQAYVTAPICSPSRAGLIAGRHQARWGVTWFGDSQFPPDGTTLAEQFGALGYATGYFGKVHYGNEEPGERGCPPQHGFDESYYGLAGKQQGRLNYLRHCEAAVAEYGVEASWRMAVQPMLDGNEPVELEGFLTAELGQRARGFVDRHAHEPFFCLLSFNAVHNFCWQLPAAELARRGLPGVSDWTGDTTEEYQQWYDGMISPNLEHGREYYLAQLELMDAEIGQLLDHLDEHGLAEDTVVVYLTDNGGSTCNYGDNTPLRGTKYTLWEGGIRVPFLLRWPAELPTGQHRDGLVSSLDLYPTLLAAAGAPSAAYADSDGVDQLPLLRGERATGHERLHWDCGFSWAIRSGQWKLAFVDPDAEQPDHIRRIEHAEPGSGLRLHDLAADPGEEVDLVGTRVDVVTELTALQRAWQTEMAASALAQSEESSVTPRPDRTHSR